MSVTTCVYVVVIVALFQYTLCYNSYNITGMIVPPQFIVDLYINWPLTNVAVLYGSLFQEDFTVEKNMVSMMDSLLRSGLISSFEYYESFQKHAEIEVFRNYIVLCDTMDMSFFFNKTSLSSKWKTWFLITSVTNDELRIHMMNLDLSYDSLLYSAHITQQQKIVVYKWHKAYKQSAVNDTQIATWNEQGNHDFLRHKFTSETNNDLQDLEISVGIYHDPPLVIINRLSEQRINVSGYLPEIWEDLGRTLNFRTRYYEIDERYEGTETNNMWSGLLGELQKNKIDVGLQTFIITHKMYDIIEPSLPIIQLSLHLYMRRPDLDKHWLAYIQPFTWQTWCCIGVTLFTLSSAMLIIYWTKQHIGTDEENNDRIKAEDTFLITIGAFLQQSCDRSPKSIAARQIFWFCFTLSMVLYTAYSAALISNLTVPKLTLPVNCVDQLLQNRYRFLVMSESGVHNLLKSSLNGNFAELYENLFANGDFISTLEDGLQLVSERGDILLASSQRIAARIGKLKCRISYTKSSVRKLPGSFAFRKAFPFSKPINRLLLKMATSGQLDRLQKVWWDIPGHYCSISVFFSMGFEHVYFIIFGWLIGLVTAFIILLIEIIYFWLNSSRRKG